MALSEHVKRQAMDAVSHKETTAQIRLYRNNDAPAQLFNQAERGKATYSGPIPEHVKKQAMDAVSHKETTAQIRLVRDNGSPSPTAAPTREANRTAERVAQLQRSGMNEASLQRSVTKDDFGRSYG